MPTRCLLKIFAEKFFAKKILADKVFADKFFADKMLTKKLFAEKVLTKIQTKFSPNSSLNRLNFPNRHA